jgi:O-antigen/teichoic acid export membrane protein
MSINKFVNPGFFLSIDLFAVLMVAPASILSLIGSEYAVAAPVLFVLSIAIFPYVIVINAISKFNNLGESKKVVSLGSVQLAAFLLSFFLLVPIYDTLGAAFSILIAAVASVLSSLIWSESRLVGYVVKSCLSIVSGLAVGYLTNILLPSFNPALVILPAVVVTLIGVFLLKITSRNEIYLMVSGITRIKAPKGQEQ